MQTQKPNWVQYLIAVLAVVLIIGSFTWMQSDTEVEFSISEADINTIAAAVIVPQAPGVDLGNLSQEVADIQATLNEDDNWENEAEDIATEEWEDRDFKEINDAIEDLYGDIDDRDDIDYVREDESTEFSGMDVDDEDATVTQYVKVKYEDITGDHVRVYLTIVSNIEEGDLEDQDISITA